MLILRHVGTIFDINKLGHVTSHAPRHYPVHDPVLSQKLRTMRASTEWHTAPVPQFVTSSNLGEKARQGSKCQGATPPERIPNSPHTDLHSCLGGNQTMNRIPNAPNQVEKDEFGTTRTIALLGAPRCQTDAANLVHEPFDLMKHCV